MGLCPLPSVHGTHDRRRAVRRPRRRLEGAPHRDRSRRAPPRACRRRRVRRRRDGDAVRGRHRTGNRPGRGICTLSAAHAGALRRMARRVVIPAGFH
ncbi:MAG: hypothetical protein E6G36_10015 [Actinobacteria bacterium]|nr:MAG: hypothetical protein E6G36_10015 [Actinomycetota bacterium]